MVQSNRFGDFPDDPQQVIGPQARGGFAPRLAKKPIAQRSDPSQVSPLARRASASFQQLARRITAWTSRLLASALILVVGLSFGRQVLRWWEAGEVAPGVGLLGPGGGSAEDQPDALQVISFGHQGWTLRRQQVQGDRQTALTALRAQCRPAEALDSAAAGLPIFEEQSLLARLALQPAIEHQPGRWRMYELDEGIPMVVVTTDWGGGLATADGANLAAPASSVLGWGIAVPESAGVWTLYSFQPQRGAAAASPGGGQIGLPPEAERLLAIQWADGSRIAAFEMAGPAERAKGVFDRWCAECGWEPTGHWHGLGEAWCRRFAGPGLLRAVDVRLGAAADGRLRGVVASWGLGVPNLAENNAP